MPERAAFEQLVDELRAGVKDGAPLEDLPRATVEAIGRFMGIPDRGDSSLELFFENGRYVKRRGHVGPYGARELSEIS